jgi:hypothetical protein
MDACKERRKGSSGKAVWCKLQRMVVYSKRGIERPLFVRTFPSWMCCNISRNKPKKSTIMRTSARRLLACILILLTGLPLFAQFIDHFDGDSLALDPNGVHGWTFYTGDGSASMKFGQCDNGCAAISVDATSDRQGIWWALIRRRVSENMDLNLLSKPRHALRIEARIKVSHAPRRVNLHLNTQRTTDFHSHLMEFDIPDTANWHTISMTTRNFDARPGDTVNGQLALMDWGLEKYRVLLDYFRVDIVNTDSAGPDLGVQVPYHPPVPDRRVFAHHELVVQDAVIDREYPDSNFNNWSGFDETGQTTLLTVSGTQFVILRWDLSAFAGRKVAGSGLLELTTYELERSPEKVKDFGMVRITEILGGDPRWDQTNATWNSLSRGEPMNRVLNDQMIVDVDVASRKQSATLATISQPVLQRMIDGKTLGIGIKPLGAVQASFYALENQGGRFGAKLHFTLDSDYSRPPQRGK